MTTSKKNTREDTPNTSRIRMHHDTVRGVRRRLISVVRVTRDLDDIGVPAGATGRITAVKKGPRYIITFDDVRYADAMLRRDEFEVTDQFLDTSRKGIITT